MNGKYWVWVIGLLVTNAFVWFSIAPAFDKTTDRLNSTLISKMDEGIPKQIGEKILNSGKNMFNLLLFVANIVTIIWGFMAHQQKERYTGAYYR